MSRWCLIACALILPVMLVAAEQPNILLLISDDHCWYDVGCAGNPDVQTPTLDRLAAEGMRFSNGWTATPVCGSTRAQLYSGRYPQNSSAFFNHPSHLLRPQQRTMPGYLQDCGYRVGIHGKIDAGPVEQYPFELLHNNEEIDAFISRDPSQPFCLVIGSGHPHAPWNQGKRHRAKYDDATLTIPSHLVDTPETREALGNYYSEISQMDQDLDELLARIHQHVTPEQLLTFWTSEQGPEFPRGKYTSYDTGSKLSFIAHWPTQIAPGVVSTALVEHSDILPTFIDLAGGDVPELDGTSFKSVLLGQRTEHREAVFSAHAHCGNVRAIRTPQYKYIRNLEPDKALTMTYSPLRTWKKPSVSYGYIQSWLTLDDPWAQACIAWFSSRPAEEFYDLTSDPWEKSNLIDDPAYAETLADLRQRLDTWLAEQQDEGIPTTTSLKREQNARKKSSTPHKYAR